MSIRYLSQQLSNGELSAEALAQETLKKAAQTDPYNRSLWAEIERNFREFERLH